LHDNFFNFLLDHVVKVDGFFKNLIGKVFEIFRLFFLLNFILFLLLQRRFYG